MKSPILVGLVVVALLTAVVVPQGAWADDGKSDREKYLSKDELAYVLNIGGATGGALSLIGSLRMLLGNPEIADKSWRAAVVGTLGQLKGYSGTFCSSAPRDFAGIGKEYCDTVGTMLADMLIPSWMQEQELDMPVVHDAAGSIGSVMGLLDVIEAKLKELDGRLDQKTNEIVAERKHLDEADWEEEDLIDWLESCFIATAAYGTPAAEEIDILRQFRDEFLLQNAPGKAFVALYYELSPPIAEFISEHEVVRATVREGLVDPLVAVVEWTQPWWEERHED